MPNLTPNASGKDRSANVIYGASGSGKTVVAASLSDKFQLRAPADRKSILALDDILFVFFDRDGKQTLDGYGLDPLYFDFSSLPPELPLWKQGVQEMLQGVVKEAASRPGIKAVVYDTVSTLNGYFDSYFLATGKANDPRLLYTMSLNAFKDFARFMLAMPVPTLWLSHMRSAYQAESVGNSAVAKDLAAQQAAQRVAKRPGVYSVDLGLTASWGDWLRPVTNFVFPLVVDDSTGKRTLLTRPGGEYYVKNRFPDILSPEEPAHLGAVFNKIDTFIDSISKEVK